MSVIKELIALGFTPAASISIAACIALWARQELSNRKQNRTREMWHAETQARVAEMEGHVEACNTDRETLKAEVATLTERTLRLSSCPRKGCPMRLP